jgi:probable HAF family extracellular repeat protein
MRTLVTLSFTLVVTATAGFAPTRAESTVMFTGLSDLTGGSFESEAWGVSPDGSTVVGRSSSASGDEAFRWTSAEGMIGLGDLPGGISSSRAWDSSTDGSVIAGVGSSASGGEAFRWTAGGGMVGLGDLPGDVFFSEGLGISADGAVVVGESRSASGAQAFRWTSGGGMVGLGDLPGGSFNSQSWSSSHDGSVVVGCGTSFSDLCGEAFRWTAGGGMVGLGDLPGGSFYSQAYDVSADGSVVVGSGYSASGKEAFRWDVGADGIAHTPDDVMIGLGDLAGGIFSSQAYAISADGSVVVGRGNSASGDEAFIWDATNGVRELHQVLVDLGLDLSGWTLTEATAISDDGLTMVGYGTNPSGNTEAWIATIPEPSTALLVALGLVGIAAGRRRAVARSD